MAAGGRLRELRQHKSLRWMHDPLVRTAAVNLALICTWCGTDSLDGAVRVPSHTLS